MKFTKVLPFLMIFLYLLVPIIRSKKDLKIEFLDVGQGDAILIRTPNEKNILVDTGPGNLVLNELGDSMPYWNKKIDALIISHFHYDHIGALIEIIEYYNVESIYYNDVEYSSSIKYWFDEKVSKMDVEIMEPEYTDNLLIDGVNFDFIYPYNLKEDDDIDNINNSSVVFILQYGEFLAYFGGDSEREQELIFAEDLYPVDVMKGSHHCSDTSNSLLVIEKLDPKDVVCLVGEGNDFGHPSPTTIKMFEGRDINVFRSDLHGRITVTTDGKNYDIVTEK